MKTALIVAATVVGCFVGSVVLAYVYLTVKSNR